MTDAKKLVPGIPEGEMEQQKLSETQIAEMKKNYKVIADLDAIDYPLETVLYGVNKWTYRNDAYRKWIIKMDTEAKERYETIIKNNTK